MRVSLAGGFHASRNVRVNQRDAPISDMYYIKPGSTCFAGCFFGDYIGSAAAPDGDLHVHLETQV